MGYDESWAHDIVSSWAVLCTRTQLLSVHYCRAMENLGGYFRLRTADTLLQDLVFCVIAQKTSPAMRRAWRTIKACAKRRNQPIKQLEKALIPAYIDVRANALKFYRLKQQLEMF